MVGAVGDDNFAPGFLESLRGDGLDVSRVKVLEGEKTGVAVIVVETESGQNRILFSPGANFKVEKGDLVDGDEAVVLFQLELPLEVVSLFSVSSIAGRHNIQRRAWTDGHRCFTTSRLRARNGWMLS